MRYFIITAALSCAMLFCNAQEDINLLKKDPNIVAYKEVSAKIKALTESHYYKIPSNFAALQSEMMKTPTPENMKHVLKKNGMVHADEFVDDITLQRSSMLKFYQKHLEFKTMDPMKRGEVLRKLLID